MKNTALNKLLAPALLIACLTSCNDSNERKAEDTAQAQAGKIYNPKLQGPGHETHENQFFVSRGKPALGAQMAEAAAAGDTTEVKMAGDTLQAK